MEIVQTVGGWKGSHFLMLRLRNRRVGCFDSTRLSTSVVCDEFRFNQATSNLSSLESPAETHIIVQWQGKDPSHMSYSTWTASCSVLPSD